MLKHQRLCYHAIRNQMRLEFGFGLCVAEVTRWYDMVDIVLAKSHVHYVLRPVVRMLWKSVWITL
jgi:hypothetical protein